MRRQGGEHFAARRQPSVMEEAKKISKAKGAAVMRCGLLGSELPSGRLITYARTGAFSYFGP